MEMEQTTIGLSREFIIHPGETLEEVIDDKEMSQKELAVRTGVTEKHICTVIKGSKSISVAFAKKLEYALGIDASFWINLQSNYDREILEFEELNLISPEEIMILKPLKNIIEYLGSLGIMNSNANEANKILDLRKILGISNLTAIPHITYNAAYRAQLASNINIDVYVLFAWQRICEMMTSRINVEGSIDIDKLKQKLPEIKKLMFLRSDLIEKELTKIFSECGIAFKIVKHFKGAPVQGFIKSCEQGRLILCMTIRQASADIFWFTLYHEIGHILNGDIKQKFVDFDSVKGDLEEKADTFASNILLNFGDYKEFVKYRDFSLKAIQKFADEQGVKSYIVIGRLQNDHLLEWNQYSGEKILYKWAFEQ
ncbi:MAG: HigA family addiction module antitoxin [Mobilitalea sp.]